MLLDISPLRCHRDYRLLFLGQVVSALGSFCTYVALPVQILELTKSSAMVGLLGGVQLVPLVPLALTALGAALAERCGDGNSVGYLYSAMSLGTHIGSDATLGQSVSFLYSEWLPQSGMEPRDFPLFFRRVQLFPDVREHEAVTEIYLPIR
jgi:hypothetical protein